LNSLDSRFRGNDEKGTKKTFYEIIINFYDYDYNEAISRMSRLKCIKYVFSPERSK